MRRISNTVRYDPALDPVTWRGFNPILMANNASPLKKALAQGKRSAALREKQRIVSPAQEQKRNRREEAEQRTAELVRKVVAALEFSMTELMAVPAPAQYERAVNQLQLHNVIVHLKTKCGVSFDSAPDNPFAKKVDLDRPGAGGSA